MTPDTYDSLFWSYTAVWVILVLYIATLGARVRRLEGVCRDTKCSDAGK
jgi:CcmD family protein